MTFIHPIWFILSIPIALTLFLWKPTSRFLFVSRIIIMMLIVAAMAEPSLYLEDKKGTVVVLADRSLSMPSNSELLQKEVVDLIQDGQTTGRRLAVLAFGKDTALEKSPVDNSFSGFVSDVGADQSNLSGALEDALSIIPNESTGRVLVISDGFWTGNSPSTVAAKLAARNIPVDYRTIRRNMTNDLAVTDVLHPDSVEPGEYFQVTAWVSAPISQQVSYKVLRNNIVILKGKRNLSSGLNRFTFQDFAKEPGTFSYQIKFSTNGENDPIIENNTAKFLIGIRGRKPLLLLSMSNKSSFAKMVANSGVNIVVKHPSEMNFSIENLSSYSGIIIEDVPANKIGTSGMENISTWVKDSGAGLMITGGKSSFAIGGYFKSPLEDIMPVSMELKQEHRKLSMAIVVVLDRSGSMTASVPGGKTKMDLANISTAQVFDMLSPSDDFGVLAVDSSSHEIIPLAKRSNLDGAKGKILSIESMGGGIFVYEGLSSAVNMILKSDAGTRHIILFADASDSEEPGDYKKLLEYCAEADISVSVIGLGSTSDSDASLLMDIAKRGNGRCFFTVQPEELPRLFAQDTFVIARNTFIEDTVTAQITAGIRMVTPKDFGRQFSIGGYNLTYLRPGANMITVSTDEYKAPIAASWLAGAGRVLCYTGEVDGKFTGSINRWQNCSSYFASLAKWVSGASSDIPSNMVITNELRNGVNIIKLHLDPERTNDPFIGKPYINTISGENGKTPISKKATMQWDDADTMVLKLPLENKNTYLSTVFIPGVAPFTLSPVCLPYSPEFKKSGSSADYSLKRIAKKTGGKERIDVSRIWDDLQIKKHITPIAQWFILAAIILFFIEIVERRIALFLTLKLSKKDLIKKSRSKGRSSKVNGVNETQFDNGERLTKPSNKGDLSNNKTSSKDDDKDDDSNGGIFTAMKEAKRRAK